MRSHNELCAGPDWEGKREKKDKQESVSEKRNGRHVVIITVSKPLFISNLVRLVTFEPLVLNGYIVYNNPIIIIIITIPF